MARFRWDAVSVKLASRSLRRWLARLGGRRAGGNWTQSSAHYSVGPFGGAMVGRACPFKSQVASKRPNPW